MKSIVSALAVSLLLAACASSTQSSGPNVTIQLEQLNSANDIFYFRGPVNIQYRVVITNPTNQALTLTRLDLQTLGSGAYSLRTNSTPMNLKVAPNATTAYQISVWGYARGGYLSSTEPVTVRGTAYFNGPSGSFVLAAAPGLAPKLGELLRAAGAGEA